MKVELTQATQKYDKLFQRAKQYIEANAVSNPKKCKELIGLLDEDQRQELQSLLESHQQSYTSSVQEDAQKRESFKKFAFVKIQKFLEQMRELGLPDDVFARQVDNYFRTYQVPRR